MEAVKKICSGCGSEMEPWKYGWHLCKCGNRLNTISGHDDVKLGNIISLNVEGRATTKETPNAQG